jgi:hypothetical protein
VADVIQAAQVVAVKVGYIHFRTAFLELADDVPTRKPLPPVTIACLARQKSEGEG